MHTVFRVPAVQRPFRFLQNELNTLFTHYTRINEPNRPAQHVRPMSAVRGPECRDQLVEGPRPAPFRRRDASGIIKGLALPVSQSLIHCSISSGRTGRSSGAVLLCVANGLSFLLETFKYTYTKRTVDWGGHNIITLV